MLPARATDVAHPATDASHAGRNEEAIVGLADNGDEAAIATARELRPLLDESTFHVVRPDSSGYDRSVFHVQHQPHGSRDTFSLANIRNAVSVVRAKGLYDADRVAAVKRESIEMSERRVLKDGAGASDPLEQAGPAPRSR